MDMISSSKKIAKHQESDKEASLSVKLTASKEIEKNKAINIMQQPPPPPPLPFNSDFFKTTINPEIFTSKLRKSLPRDTDEETTRSFDAVVNELKSKFTKIKDNLDNSYNSEKTYKKDIQGLFNRENKKELERTNLSKQENKSSISIGIHASCKKNKSEIEEYSKSKNILHPITGNFLFLCISSLNFLTHSKALSSIYFSIIFFC